MSFLNSVLNSIGSKDPQSPSLPPRTTKAQPPSTTLRAPDVKDAIATHQPHAQISSKRKAEDALESPKEKTAKTVHNTEPKADSNATKSSVTATAKVQPVLISKSKSPAVYGGTSKPKLGPKPLANSTSSQQTPKSDPRGPPPKEPKKGSYAEIMARAKANQAKPQAVGTINHKPKEKGALSYKKEIKLQNKAKRDRKLGVLRGQDRSQPSSADDNSKFGHAKSKMGKPRPELPAKKPKPQPVYKGTMNPASMTAKAKEKAAAQTARRGNEYAGTDEELDEDEELEEDDGYGYDEEESDDMEAGFSDVEQEESAADRVAKKEDEDEAKLEARLKREKEERKKRVEELAKRAKPQRY